MGYTYESILSEIGKLTRNASGSTKVGKDFSSGLPFKHKKIQKELSDDKLKQIKDLESGMRNATEYAVYKPLFNKFCNMLDIKPTIIYGIKYNDNTIDVKYEDMDKEITVPNGSTLTHVSPNEFNELKPSFKSKDPSKDSNATRGGYLYSSPRIYVTLNKNALVSAKNIADIGQNVKIHGYTIPENIKTVKVDPALQNSARLGACYIETLFPIKVHKISDKDLKEASDKKKEEDNNKKKMAGAAIAGAAIGAGAAIAATKASNKVKKESVMVDLYESYDNGKISKENFDIYMDILK